MDAAPGFDGSDFNVTKLLGISGEKLTLVRRKAKITIAIQAECLG